MKLSPSNAGQGREIQSNLLSTIRCRMPHRHCRYTRQREHLTLNFSLTIQGVFRKGNWTRLLIIDAVVDPRTKVTRISSNREARSLLQLACVTPRRPLT